MDTNYPNILESDVTKYLCNPLFPFLHSIVSIREFVAKKNLLKNIITLNQLDSKDPMIYFYEF